MTSIAISIITYKRPELLAQTLESLKTINLPSGVDVRIIVIDNDSAKTAQSVVRASIENFPYPMEYAIEEKHAIPHARNKALELAESYDYIAFIDDDDRADCNWLVRLYDAATTYDAGVVKGQVEYIFPSGKEYLQTLDIFAPVLTLTGGELDSAWTNNVLFSTSIYKNNGLKFDIAFLKTGGSDTYFFSCARKNGTRIVMCQEAIIRTIVPEQRASFKWLAVRHLRIGATLTLTDILLNGYRYACWQALKSTGSSTAYCLRLWRGVFFKTVPAIHTVMVMLFMVGRIAGMFHISPREYK